ncbi:MAG: hypothetical protein IKH75_01320 [Ruminococcus sp.]|nr:hypothetical protein [Ruminococcus sp.]
MKETYTVMFCEKEEIDKALARFAKKAAIYGKTFSTESGEPYVMKRDILEPDPVTHTLKLVGDELVEVYDLTIDSEVIRKDGYSVVAKLEHLEEGNFIYAFADDVSPEWQKAEPFCEHCKTKHFRKNTFVVRHEDGSEKQVGSTCLKDYCGIDPKYYAWLHQLEDLILSDRFEGYDFERMPKAQHVYELDKVLALAIEVCDQQGYRKSEEPGCNKSVLYDRVTGNDIPSDEALAQAREIIAVCKELKSIDELFHESYEYGEFKLNWHKYNDPAIEEIENMTEFNDSRFKSLEEYKKWRLDCLYSGIAGIYEDEDGNYHTEGGARERWSKHYPFTFSARKADFLVGSIRPLAKVEYCKDTHLGFIAFAPVAYARYIEALESDKKKLALNEELAANSQYVGKPGEKIVLDLSKMELITSFENQWGYTYLYKMIDKNGNVMIWYSSRHVEPFTHGKATVKSHSERDGIKQTVVTRCIAC